MSPVEILGMSKCAATNSACVPLPAPGGPTSTSLTRLASQWSSVSGASGRWAKGPGSAEEAFVVALHQLALDLLHGVEGDAHHDQHSGAAEREVLVLPA